MEIDTFIRTRWPVLHSARMSSFVHPAAMSEFACCVAQAMHPDVDVPLHASRSAKKHLRSVEEVTLVCTTARSLRTRQRIGSGTVGSLHVANRSVYTVSGAQTTTTDKAQKETRQVVRDVSTCRGESRLGNRTIVRRATPGRSYDVHRSQPLPPKRLRPAMRRLQ